VSTLTRGKIERCIGVLAASGVVARLDGGRYKLADGVLPLLTEPARAALEGEMRSAIMQALAFLDSARKGGMQTGWRHDDHVLLDAQGAGSGGFPPMLRDLVVPAMGDLAARLGRPGARFLDIGVGVARLAIAMCRAFPEIRVVGVDPYDAALAVARENIAREGLAERIELRQSSVEDVEDESVFELAWLPLVFIPSAIVPRAVDRVRAALRPGGWVIAPALGASGDELQRAVWALQNELWGGPVLKPADVEEILRAARLSSVQTLIGPPWAPAVVLGQRA
jgi:precorrin-6B methylase 2